MLKSTFLHLKNVGPKKEQEFWKKGIVNWDQYHFESGQYPLSSELTPLSPLQKSIEAYNSGNMLFFATNIPSNALYRVALEFPENTLFLDIETTGLSLHYDIITLIGWSIGNKFDVCINGQKDTCLKQAFMTAKTIVTFNGTLFDLKFLKKYYPEFNIPPVHIDLRYLAKRVGLTGGQKKIEKEIGFTRANDVKDMLGEAAPILWHQYRRGEQDALKRLITYNHEDIEGMKYIFDYCVKKLITIDSIPAKIRPKCKFSCSPSKLVWANSCHADGIFIQEYVGSSKPLIEYYKLNEIYPLDNFAVAGIDLVSSETRETGCCLLRGNVAQTCRLKSDDEIIAWILESKANLVSIDSPLSIPSGRTSFFDEDPHREYGIMRKCERTLKRRGINVYPCLIPSMQKLTRRGMALAEKLRNQGIPVIESYPGAAQDIMSIPRKQAGLDYLVLGLKEFGLTGDFIETPVSHDELDAITSAVVGLFFWTGMFEALGNPLEEYLIIPDVNGDYKAWLNRKVVGLSNNSEVSPEAKEQLRKQKFELLDFREIEQALEAQNELAVRAYSLAKEIGIPIDLQRKWLGKDLVSRYQSKRNLFVQGITAKGDQALMLESFGPTFSLADNIFDMLAKP